MFFLKAFEKMQPLIRAIRSQCKLNLEFNIRSLDSFSTFATGREIGHECVPNLIYDAPLSTPVLGFARFGAIGSYIQRCFSTAVDPLVSSSQDSASPGTDMPSRIKFKRLDKTARHIMQILDKEAVEDIRTQREIPDIKPGYIIQIKLEVPENKRRITTIKGIVIARRNAGPNTTFRIRRLVSGVGIENVLPLYSPNIKEIQVLDKKKVRRAKLYYLRGKMNPLKN